MKLSSNGSDEELDEASLWGVGGLETPVLEHRKVETVKQKLPNSARCLNGVMMII